MLGTRRVRRAHGESAPDVEPVALPDGRTLGVEVKARKRAPRVLVQALEQAARYFARPVVPVVVLRPFDGSPLAILALDDLARLVGLDVATVARRATRKRSRQSGQLDWLADTKPRPSGATGQQ